MKRLFIPLAALTLTACQMTTEAADTYPKWQVATQPFPPEVLGALPADIPYSDVIARLDDDIGGPCYYYRRDGVTYPLTTSRMVAEGSDGQPFCVM